MDSGQPKGQTLVYNDPNVVLGSSGSSIPVVSAPVAQEPLEQNTTTPSVIMPQPEVAVVEESKTQQSVDKLKLFRFNKSAMLATSAALVLIALVGVGSVLLSLSNKNKTNSASSSNIEQNYKPQSLSVSNVAGYNSLLTGRAQNLTVNGQLSVANSLVLTPTTTPSNPTLGQLYYNGGDNTPYFYNGKNFISLIPASSVTIGGSSANLSLGNGLGLQGTSLLNTGVTSINGTPDQILVSSNSGTVQISLPSSISANSITSGVLNSLSNYEINGVQINSSNLSDGGNIAKLTGSGPQAFTGNNEFTGKVIDQNTTNSTSAFSIQNAAGANIFTADTSNSAINIGQGASLDSTTSTNTESPSYVAVSGNYAYVLSNTSNTLQVFNVSNSSSPSLINTTTTGSSPESIAVSGNYAYVVNNSSNSLQIFNVSNPNSPALVSTTSTNNCPDSVTVSGSYVYVVNNCANNMQIFNVSNPNSPALVSTTVTGSSPESIAVSGNYAYVVNNSSNSLQIFNVSNPNSPVPDSAIITGNCPVSVSASGNYAYVINSCNNTFQVFNVSNPNSPTLVSTSLTGNNPLSLNVSGNYAYLTNDNDNTLEVFDITKPANPIVADTITTGNCPAGVSAANGYAYVVNNCSNTLQAFNVLTAINVNVEGNLSVSQIISGSTLSLQGTNSNISSSESANLITNPDFTTSDWKATNSSNPDHVASSGNYAYVINEDDTTLQIYDVSNPASPVSKSITSLGGVPTSVVISGNYAYIINLEPSGVPAELQIYDVSNPASPVSKSTTVINGDPASAAISGNYLYIEGAGGGESNVYVYDVSNPAAPVVAGSVSVGRIYTGYITISGNYAYVINSESDEFQIINISTPTSPTLDSTTSTGYWPIGVAVEGSYAYVVNSNSSTMEVFDISTPTSPTLVSTTATNVYPQAVAISGNYAYVTTSDNNTMQVFNISSPNNPLPVAAPSTGNYPIFVTVSSNYAYVVNYNDSSLQIFDITNPQNPNLDSTTQTGVTSWSVTSTTATCTTIYCGKLYTNQFSAVPGASYEVKFTTSGAAGKYCYVYVGDVGTQSCYSEGQQDVVVQASDTTGLSISINGINGIVITDVQVYQINPATSSLQILNYQGETALAVSTPGSGSEYIGVSSGMNSESSSSNDTAIGDFALQDNTSGSNNTAIGNYSLQQNTSGFDNTAIGEGALSGNTVGSYNTAIGAYASVDDGLTNATAIGYNAEVAENNAIVLGSGASVGIGTSSPASTLNVVDEGGWVDNFVANSTSYTTNSSGSDTQGLSATWYNSTSTNNAYQIPGNGTLAYSGTDGPINWADLTTTRPAGVNATYINAQWTGYLYAPASGRYELCTESDDGSRMYLSGTEIVNNWYSQGDTERCSYMNLAANVWYPITVQYYQGSSAALMFLEWYEADVDGGSFENIPAADLSTTEPTGQIYTAGFTLNPTVTVQADTNIWDGTYGLQQDVIGVKNSSGNLVGGLTSYGALQGSNGSGTNISGGNIIVAGGQGTGSANGGSIDFQVAPASTSGLSSNSLVTVASLSGVNGAATFENSTNSTTAFLVQNSTGANIFTVDTSDGRVGVGTAANTPGNLLSVGALTTAAGTYQISVTTGGTTNSGIVVQDVASQSSGYAFMLQSSAGASLASIDYLGNLSVKAITAGGTLTLNGHVITGNTSGNTTAAAQASGLGSTGTCSLTPANYAAANDDAGTIVLTPGGTGIAAGTQCTITFSTAYGSYPHVVISPANAASEVLGAYAAAASSTTFSIGFTAAGSSGTAYTFNYFVAQ